MCVHTLLQRSTIGFKMNKLNKQTNKNNCKLIVVFSYHINIKSATVKMHRTCPSRRVRYSQAVHLFPTIASLNKE